VQLVLTVTDDACRSLADLIKHLHDKLAIPPEKEFAIFAGQFDDGASPFLERTSQ
jgi:hypothetical protein